MDIPIKAEVWCADGRCGQTTSVVINPTTEEVTHVVVKSKAFPQQERMVPIHLVKETTSDTIRLQCSQAELAEMDEFIEHEFLRVEMPVTEYAPGNYVLWPYTLTKDEYVDVVHEKVPTGERALHRGAEVEAADGHVGQVDEFVIDPATGHITNLVLREGHLWGKKDVVIPVSEIEDIMEDTVYLKLNKKAIASMPAVPIKRWWR